LFLLVKTYSSYFHKNTTVTEPILNQVIQKKDKEIKIHRNGDLIKKLDTILIDECSTVRADLLDAIDESLRKNRKTKEVFGGVQIIFIGDLLQISPIVHRSEKEVVEDNYPKGCYFFNSRVFKKAKFETHQLSKIFRQSDESFINLLNKFRIAKVDDNDLSLINKRYQGEDFEIPEETSPLRNVDHDISLGNKFKF
jgi:hypothetical protein